MNIEEKNVKVAVVQAAPVLFDLEKTTNKVVYLIEKAAKEGAKIIVFPESFIPCYPRGLSFGFVVGSRTQEGRTDWLRYNKNSFNENSKESDLIAKACEEHQVYVSIGVTEKEDDTGSLYCTNYIYSPEGVIINKHRKLKPTGSERCIWGEGDGSNIQVSETPYGKIGALTCWENYMPLSRVAMYQEGVSLYLAPTADSRETWQHSMRHIAIEGRCFVLTCNQYVTKSMYPTDLETYDELANVDEVMSRGGSAIIDPFGNYVVGPIYDKEVILTAVLNLDLITSSRFDFDPNGHYSRKDIFQLFVNKTNYDELIKPEAYEIDEYCIDENQE